MTSSFSSANRGVEDFYADTKTLTYGTHKPSNEAVEKMVNDLEKQLVCLFFVFF